MKKTLVAFFLLFSLILSLAACDGASYDPTLTVPEDMRVGEVGDG